MPVDETQIPIGEIRTVENSHFDFFYRQSEPFGNRIGDQILSIDGGGKPGIDHSLVVNRNDNQLNTLWSDFNNAISIKSLKPIVKMIVMSDKVSGRQLIVHGTQPSCQLYSANWLSEDKSDFPHIQHNAICFETQDFTDAINQSQFPNVIIDKGDKYEQVSVFSFRII